MGRPESVRPGDATEIKTSMATTHTGTFPIGFRRGWSEWQKDLQAISRWAKAQEFDAIDLGALRAEDLSTLNSHGLHLGSVDLLEFGKLMDTDAGKRKERIARNVSYVAESSDMGAHIFFTCIIPADPIAPRAENYKLAVESFAPIAEACESVGASLAIEGWPGGAPHLANLCCTPETVRAFLKDVGSGAGINYDPSHLIRLGVDHVRFLQEFLPQIRHVHAKDTELFEDARYEFGAQPATFAKPHGFGEWAWRYTIPGQGAARWGEIFSILSSGGYRGIVSVELEDENFNGTEAGEKAGLKQSLEYLRSA